MSETILCQHGQPARACPRCGTFRYEEALHAIQTGVKLELDAEIPGLDQRLLRVIKHLRVGNNARACDAAGLVRLLIAKGILTEEEYEAAITAELNAEVVRDEERLAEKFGSSFHLH